jgi:hypothetical protein
MARLIRTIEGEIVPRLLLSLSGSLVSAREGHDCDAVAELAHLVLVREEVGAADIVRIIYPKGPPQLDRACLGLIAPAARRLGEIWERNECNLHELLQGLSRLESVIREVNARSLDP